MSVTQAKRLGFLRHTHTGEFVAAASALALCVALFALAWFGSDQPPGRANGAERATTENGWDGLTIVRWLIVATVIVAVGSLLLHISQRAHGASTDTAAAVTVLGLLTALALTYRVLIDLPSAPSVVDQKVGAYLGLLSAYGVALGGYHALRAARLRDRALAAGQAPPAASPTATGSALAEPPQSR